MRKNIVFIWAAAVDLVIDSILGAVWFSLFVTLLSAGIGLVPAFGVGILLFFVAASLTRFTGSIERRRAAAVYAVDIPAPFRRSTAVVGWRRPFAVGFTDLVDPVTWRVLLHHVLTMLLGSALALLFWGGSALTARVASGAGGGVLWAVVVGVVSLAVVVLYVYGAGRLDRALATALLGPSRTAQLAGRVDALAEARQGAVDSAEIERRRIERDLHDGVQPRLVTTALTLGMARARFDTDPAGARQLLDQAHREVKDSITELRQLARGIHPAVLTDRGLDAALSAVASRSPVPVTLEVRLDERVDAEIEAVVYFAVAEALTNVAKHSGASSCEVLVSRETGAVRATIGDDGAGGAAFVPGGGLAGMRDRVRAAGGSIRVDSPAGGPTSIVVEVPCAS